MPITSRRIGATNGRSGMANSSRYADRVIGASNKKKRSAAIAVTSASMVGLLIQGSRPTSRARGIKTHAAFMALMLILYRRARVAIEKHGALIDAHGLGKRLTVKMSLIVRDMTI